MLPLNLLQSIQDSLDKTERMPVLFLGHGNPMNAIRENEFTKGFRKISEEIPRPRLILCVSAHWETSGTFVTAMESPGTIHDFGGFPKELYQVQYPAAGHPSFATEIKQMVTGLEVRLNYDRGLDHGAWSVIKHLYPNADIPVIQLSLDYQKNPRHHYELARQLGSLREKGVLIIGSGNMVHNLQLVDWQNMDTIGFGFDWALEAREKMNRFIIDGNHEALINYSANGKAFNLAIPTPEHFLPLIYVLGLKENGEKISFFNDKAVAGSLTMTSVKISS